MTLLYKNITAIAHLYHKKITRTPTPNQQVRFVLPQPDRRRILLWTWSNRLWTLQERSLEAKLELLYKGHLYPLALSVIRSFATSYLEDERIDENTRKQRTQEIERMTMSTHKMYADHLYSKTQYQEDELMQFSMQKRDAALPNLDTEAVAEMILARIVRSVRARSARILNLSLSLVFTR